MPLYAIMEWLPPTRETARRLDLLALEQMVRALVASVDEGPNAVRVLDVSAIGNTNLNITERQTHA